jgi:hypothetical protein
MIYDIVCVCVCVEERIVSEIEIVLSDRTHGVIDSFICW